MTEVYNNEWLKFIIYFCLSSSQPRHPEQTAAVLGPGSDVAVHILVVVQLVGGQPVRRRKSDREVRRLGRRRPTRRRFEPTFGQWQSTFAIPYWQWQWTWPNQAFKPFPQLVENWPQSPRICLKKRRLTVRFWDLMKEHSIEIHATFEVAGGGMR